MPGCQAGRAASPAADSGAAINARQATEVAVTSMTYPGQPASVAAARRLARGLLAGSPLVDDLELIVSELVTNAIRHTPSGQEGGTFTITIRHRPGMARIEVEDDGNGQWAVRPRDAAAEGGRGLMLVAALADEFGYGVTRARRKVVWAQVIWRTGT